MSDSNLHLYKCHFTHSLGGFLELIRGVDADLSALLYKFMSKEKGRKSLEKKTLIRHKVTVQILYEYSSEMF